MPILNQRLPCYKHKRHLIAVQPPLLFVFMIAI